MAASAARGLGLNFPPYCLSMPFCVTISYCAVIALLARGRYGFLIVRFSSYTHDVCRVFADMLLTL
jgi:hypothetical protein